MMEVCARKLVVILDFAQKSKELLLGGRVTLA